MSRLKILRLRATRHVDAIGVGLEARIADRMALYRRHGLEKVYARAEGAFMRWMQARGALAPLDDPGRPGSAWWQAVNREICHDSQLASLVHDAHLDWEQLELEAPVRGLRLFAAPSSGRWYRAHNASVMQASLKHRALAAAEPRWERAFINIALYRMLALQAVAEGAALGRIGAILSHPRVPLVDLFVGRNGLYPRQDPASERDIREGLLDGAPGGLFALNPGMLRPAELMPLAAGWLELPDVARIVMSEGRAYPDLVEAPGPPVAARPEAPVTIAGRPGRRTSAARAGPRRNGACAAAAPRGWVGRADR